MQWLLLLHQIPPSPAYLRAKVMRRLNQLGALPIKNSAYLLPHRDETQEDFEWLRREIQQQGGEAWLFRCEAVGGFTDESIQEAFRALRSPDYVALAEETRALVEQLRADTESAAAADAPMRKLRKRLEELGRIDFFGAPGKHEIEVLMKEIERLRSEPQLDTGRAARTDYQGRVWVTRKGVKVDRIGSAWLIRRFIDPAARFQFIDPDTYQHAEKELRFDMFEGEFTHEGELCTFEALLRYFGLTDAALAAIGEVVHDIDLKDSRFQRPETAGVGHLIDGIALRHRDDTQRLQDGSFLFDSLYAQYDAEAKST